MITQSNLVSCNFSSSSLPLKIKNPRITTASLHPQKQLLEKKTLNSPNFLKPQCFKNSILPFHKKSQLQICHSVLESKDSEKDSNNGKDGRDWTTSILLFVLYGALMYYVFKLAPNQTPSTDLYFLKKLLNLTGDDGFEMNQVIVSLWYIMGLWPLVYTMLLIPSGRSSKSKIQVWPFAILSCFGGAYALLPYFVLWRPPPPPVDETELGRWPLNFLESKLTAGVSLAAGFGLFVYGGLSNGDVWKEFYQYFGGSKFIHVMSLDFILLSAFAPFWVYNDMSARKWFDKGSWLLPVSLVPLLGPCLYLLLRPSLSEMPVSLTPTSSDNK